MAGDVQSYLDAVPLQHLDGGEIRHGRRIWIALWLVLIAHLAALYWAVRNDVERRDFADNRPVEVALIESPALPAIPELRKAPPSPRRAPLANRVAHPVSPRTEPIPDALPVPSVTLFNPDGSLHLPEEAKPQRGLPQPDIIKGRELMGRGLDCEAPDALGTGESLEESVARKYLSWIGLYNPYSAQRRAEQFEERKERCKRWRGQS